MDGWWVRPLYLSALQLMSGSCPACLCTWAQQYLALEHACSCQKIPTSASIFLTLCSQLGDSNFLPASRRVGVPSAEGKAHAPASIKLYTSAMCY